jgi:protein-disulfide isomerase
MLGMKTASLLAATVAAGTVLTVVVVRGGADVQPTEAAASPPLALRAGERAVLPEPALVASTTAAVRTPPPQAAAAAGDLECPQMAAGECDKPCAPPAGGECEGQPCEGCNGPPAEERAARLDVSTEGASALGPADARVTIVEFSDYQCRFCEKAMSTVHALAALYPKDVRVVLKNFPMPGHKHARLAAEAALAAGEQGKYWEMHDLILANQENLGRAALDDYAQKLGLDIGRFRAALDDGRFAAQVDRDIEDGKALGLKGVPSFVINGRLVVGARPLEDFKQIVEEELAATR